MSKKAKSPSKSASKRKVVIKDLKAKDAGSVKGGANYDLIQKHKDLFKFGR
jgi:hypothetical protein